LTLTLKLLPSFPSIPSFLFVYLLDSERTKETEVPL
jgi:hypothetical protein